MAEGLVSKLKQLRVVDLREALLDNPDERLVAAARAKAAQLASNPLTANAAACLTEQELTELVNFAGAVAEARIPALGRTGLLALVAAIAAAGFFAHRRIV